MIKLGEMLQGLQKHEHCDKCGNPWWFMHPEAKVCSTCGITVRLVNGSEGKSGKASKEEIQSGGENKVPRPQEQSPSAP